MKNVAFDLNFDFTSAFSVGLTIAIVTGTFPGTASKAFFLARNRSKIEINEYLLPAEYH